MKKLLLLLLLMAVPALAKGPKHNFQDPLMNDEMNNIYKDIQFPKISYGSASTMTITQLNVSTLTLSGSLNTAFINGTFIGLGRNRILNGDMRVDQFHEGAGYATSVGGSLAGGGLNGGQAFYALDQWRFEATVSSTFTITRTNESLPPTVANSLFNQAMRVSFISSSTIAASDAANMEYPMDPVYQSDFGWGSSAAVPVTLQFWVLCAAAGSHSISFLNGIDSRSYVSTYTIATPNVWQKEVITVPGDTAGTPAVWPTSGTVFGLKVVWDMGSGSNITTSNLNQWQTGALWRAAGTNDFTTQLAAVYFTGVQLEIGTTATSFEYMPLDMEIHALQKYFYKTFPQGTAVASATGFPGSVGYVAQIAGTAPGPGFAISLRFPAEMLYTPVVTTYNPGTANAKWRNSSANTDSATPLIFNSAPTGLIIHNPQVAGDGAGTLQAIHLTANSRLGGS